LWLLDNLPLAPSVFLDITLSLLDCSDLSHLSSCPLNLSGLGHDLSGVGRDLGPSSGFNLFQSLNSVPDGSLSLTLMFMLDSFHLNGGL
jgi:hypothetical protein